MDAALQKTAPSKGLSVLLLEEENVMRIKAAEVRPASSGLTIITGKNGEGKSSLLTGLQAALSGAKALPEIPLREGATQGKIGVILAEDGEVAWTIQCKLTTENKFALTLLDGNGREQSKPRAILDELIGGGLVFDPLAFMRQPPSKQRDQLMQALPGLAAELDSIATERQRLFRLGQDERAAVKTLKGAFDALTFPGKDAQAAELLSSADVLTELEAAQGVISSSNALSVQVESALDLIARLTNQQVDLQRELEETTKRLADERSKCEALETQAATAALHADQVDMPGLKLKLAGVEEHNNKVRTAAAWSNAKKSYQDAGFKLDATEFAIGKLDKQKEELLAATPLPVDGLSFTDDGLIYNGFPLAQASSAQQLRVATGITMGLNPRLRLIIIRDGSLLDDDSVALLEQLTIEQGFQVFMECVGTDGSKGILIEDGCTPGMAPVLEAADAR